MPPGPTFVFLFLLEELNDTYLAKYALEMQVMRSDCFLIPDTSTLTYNVIAGLSALLADYTRCHQLWCLRILVEENEVILITEKLSIIVLSFLRFFS